MTRYPVPRKAPPTIKFAPREVFESILEYYVIPTFDLIIEMPGGKGVVLVRRIIAPYENRWALPGLRMFKPEGIEDVIRRVAVDELGLDVDVASRRFVGQYVGRFRTEHERQDISTCYAVRSADAEVKVNRDHFSGYRLIEKRDEIPRSIGSMYRHYLHTYFGEMIYLQ